MSGSSSTPKLVTVTISPDPGQEYDFEGLNGYEEFGRPFQYNLDLSLDTAVADLTTLLGASVTVGFPHGDGVTRYVNGLVTRASFDGLSPGGSYRYRLELRPWIWMLSQVQDCAIFQNKSVWDIITTVFNTIGSANFSDKRVNQAGSNTLDYCVQYNETSLDFVTRLMEKYGLYYYFTHDNGTHTVVMADDPNSHTALTSSIPFAKQQTEYRDIDAHLWDFTSDLRLRPGKTTFRDYNFTNSNGDLEAKVMQGGQSQYDNMEVYEYPGLYAVAADGTKVADMRMNRLRAPRQLVHATTNAHGMAAGMKFTLDKFDDTSQNMEWLVIGASISVDAASSIAESQGQAAETFRCTFTAMPGTDPFGLEERTPWPTISGVQTAKVVGDSGEEVTTDQYGRIKVKFFWDRSATTGQDASCFIRVAQMWAGASWGSMFIPRIGMEVVVEFLEGNPDRPLITGCVYNDANTVPYALDANKTQSGIKTNTSKGGGGSNELRFEDLKGSEQIFVHAQMNMDTTVENYRTLTVNGTKKSDGSTASKGTAVNTVTINKGDDVTTVTDGNQTVTVSAGDQSVTVSQGNQSVTVSQGNQTIEVNQGNHSLKVDAGTSTIEAGQSVTLKVGSNSIAMDTSSITLTCGSNSVKLDATGVTVNGAEVKLTASADMTLTGAMIAIN